MLLTRAWHIRVAPVTTGPLLCGTTGHTRGNRPVAEWSTLGVGMGHGRVAMAGCLVGLAALACGCQGGLASGGAAPASATGATTAAATTTPRHWTMPDEVGANLQDAQNRIQAVTGDPLFLTSSHDATGRQRMQVRDRDWKVCTQNVAPGATFAMNAKIDFGAVKLTENCP